MALAVGEGIHTGGGVKLSVNLVTEAPRPTSGALLEASSLLRRKEEADSG